MLLRLAYLGVANAFALLRLLPMSDRDKDVEILALRHQLAVLRRQLGSERTRFTPSDRALLAALLHHLPRAVLKHLHLVVRPDTVLRWHRDLIAGDTLCDPGANERDGRVPCARSAPWSCGWYTKTRKGAIGEDTANCCCSE